MRVDWGYPPVLDSPPLEEAQGEPRPLNAFGRIQDPRLSHDDRDPLSEGPSMDRGRSVGQSQAGRTEQARADRARVLVVDDDLDTLELLGARLRKDGFEALTARLGLMALRQAYDNNPDAVILDIMMPDMDGFEVCRRLRELTDAIILFVSAKGQTEDILQGLQLGADDYIVKPFHYSELAMRPRAARFS